MSCEDECDYKALPRKSWGFFDKDDGVLWQPGDPVLLWDAEESELSPNDGNRFQRFASVTAAEGAGADKAKLEEQWPQMPNKERNLPISHDRAATRSKVILRVSKELGRKHELDPIPEIHVRLAAPVQLRAMCCGSRAGTASGRVLRLVEVFCIRTGTRSR